MPVTIDKVEDVGSERIVRARLGEHPLSAIVREGVAIPTDAAMRFAPDALNLYADSRLVGRV